MKQITKYSKEWWSPDCMTSLNKYRVSCDIQHWKEFKTNICIAKRNFLNKKIYKIVSSNKRPWDLMNWVRKKSIPTIESISYEN